VSGGTVAVDANPAARPAHTGTEVYAREVARRLPSAAPDLRFVLYASRPGDVRGLDLTVLPGRRLWSQGRLCGELWRARPDLFFAPSHVVPFLAPGRALTVVHDLAFERHPDAYPSGTLAYLRLTTRWAERRCRLLLTVSQSTADDLIRLHGVDAARLRVVPLGGGEPPPPPPEREAVCARLAELGVSGPFVLHVGRVEPRKNQVTALEAVERLPDLLFVSVGSVADAAMGARLAASPRCRQLGRLPDADVEVLYAGAEALLFPSLYEGFGLPVLEAMRRGLPVVTSAVASLPEVGGDAAVYADDPRDAAALADALARTLGEREVLGRRGMERAAGFTWDRTAAGVAAAMRELL
jgi:glycosyltransferase involved in cell wall biosynthesis